MRLRRLLAAVWTRLVVDSVGAQTRACARQPALSVHADRVRAVDVGLEGEGALVAALRRLSVERFLQH